MVGEKAHMINNHSAVVKSGNDKADVIFKMALWHTIELTIEDLCVTADGDIVIVKEGATENGNDQV